MLKAYIFRFKIRAFTVHLRKKYEILGDTFMNKCIADTAWYPASVGNKYVTIILLYIYES